MKKKTFDCVEMKRRGAERIYKKIAAMTPQQQLAFWQQRTHELRERQQNVQRKHKPHTVVGQATLT